MARSIVLVHLFFLIVMSHSVMAAAASSGVNKNVAQAKEWVAQNPEQPKMWSSLVYVCFKNKKYDEARQYALKYLEKFGNDRSKHTEIIERYLVASWVELGDYNQVESCVSKLLQERPKHKFRSDLLFLDAKAALRCKSYVKAYEKYKMLADADPDENICQKSKYFVAYSAFLLAAEMRKNGEAEERVAKQYQLALELLDKFRKADVGDKSLLNRTDLHVIQCYRRLGKYDSLDEAIKNALSSPEHQGDKGLLLYEQAESCFEREQWDVALESYNSLLKWASLKPENKRILQGREDLIDYHRLLCLLNAGNETEFEQASIKFVDKYADSNTAARIAYAKAMIPFKKGNWSKANAALAAFLEKYPNPPEEVKLQAEHDLLNSLIFGNKCDQARQYIQKKLAETAQSPGHRGLQFLSAMADYKEGKWSESSVAMCQLIEQAPEGETAAHARLYVGICKMNEARQKNRGGSKDAAAPLQAEGRKYLIDWAKNQKPAIKTDMDALFYQNDFAALSDAANKYLKTGDQSDWAKKAQMLKWLGLVSINQDPPNIQDGKKYFDQACQISKQGSKRVGSEVAITARLWLAWIALYDDDQSQALNVLKEMKSLPESTLKTETIRKFQYLIY
ncbi:hypothetical protein LLG95_10275 [bacterium]|nr:hypothetical protein [bacterium]